MVDHRLDFWVDALNPRDVWGENNIPTQPESRKKFIIDIIVIYRYYRYYTLTEWPMLSV